jgi:hypothetical protein
MKEFPSCISIIEKFIQSEIDINHSSNEYILALNECTTLEDLIEEVKVWKNQTRPWPTPVPFTYLQKYIQTS